MFANWACTKNDVGSSLAKIANMAKTSEMADISKMAKVAKLTKTGKIAETGIMIFLKTFKIWVFFEKIDGFSKKLEFYSKSLKVAYLL